MRKGLHRGSVSRSLRYHERFDTDEKFRERLRKCSKESHRKQKIKVNKRCIDCGVLIQPKSIRCKRCSIRYNYKKYRS